MRDVCLYIHGSVISKLMDILYVLMALPTQHLTGKRGETEHRVLLLLRGLYSV